MADRGTMIDIGDVETITVIRALGGLGDVLVALPALAALRTRFPRANIRYIGMPQTAAILGRFPALIDSFVPFPGFPGVVELPFTADGLARFLAEQRGQRPDLAIQMHGSGGVTNSFSALLEPGALLAYHVPGTWRPGPLALPFPDALSERDRWLALVGSIGAAEVAEPSFPIGPADRAMLANLMPGAAARPYVVLHAGASDPARRWPAERFALVGDRLARAGLEIVLTGTDAERAVVDRVAAAMEEPALDLCGRTELGVAAALIEGAHLVVTNDTGTSHLAASLRTPSVIIFIASDPLRWAPADAARHRTVGRGVPDGVIGRTHLRPVPTIPDVDDVAEAVEALLAVPA